MHTKTSYPSNYIKLMKTFKVQSQKPNIKRSAKCSSLSEPIKVLKQINQFWVFEHFPRCFCFLSAVTAQWMELKCVANKFNGNGNIFLLIAKTIDNNSRKIMVESINLVCQRENKLADKLFFTWNLLLIHVRICYALCHWLMKKWTARNSHYA